MVGRRTEKSRLKRSIGKLQDKMREIRHWKVGEQVDKINQMLRGHYNYYGMGGNYQSLDKVYYITKLFLKKMLSSRSWKGKVTWELFKRIMEKYPILRPFIKTPFAKFNEYVML